MPDVPGLHQRWRNLSLMSFASRWIYAWRSLDVDEIQALVSPEIEFHVGVDSYAEPLRGVGDLTAALTDPDFAWDLRSAAHLTGLITGENVLVIDYRDDVETSFTETLMFERGRVHWRQIESDMFSLDGPSGS